MYLCEVWEELNTTVWHFGLLGGCVSSFFQLDVYLGNPDRKAPKNAFFREIMHKEFLNCYNMGSSSEVGGKELCVTLFSLPALLAISVG